MKHIVFSAFLVIILAFTAAAALSCGKTASLVVDFAAEPAGKLFSVALYGGSKAVCESAAMEFTFKGGTVSACRVTLNYADETSAAAVVDIWENYSGIEHASADGAAVTYDYVIEKGNSKSSKFSGMNLAGVIAEVESVGGVVREES